VIGSGISLSWAMQSEPEQYKGRWHDRMPELLARLILIVGNKNLAYFDFTQARC
jgi:hypothetical protein